MTTIDDKILEEPVPENAVEKVLFSLNTSEKRLSADIIKKCNFSPFKVYLRKLEFGGFWMEVDGDKMTAKGKIVYWHELYNALVLCRLKEYADKLCSVMNNE